MNTESTIEVSAVVTPNCAIDNRNQISSHRTLQNPDNRKNQKNQPIPRLVIGFFSPGLNHRGGVLRPVAPLFCR
jgi:hypothetical protein